MTGPRQTLPSRGFVRYDSSIEEEILRFNLEAYPTRRADWVGPRWRWMFLASAGRLGVDPMVWMYSAGHRIVAHQGAIPVRLRVLGREFVTGWFVETMVLESHRGKAIGPMVIKRALEDLPVNLSLGQTDNMRALQLALGWRQVAPLKTFVYALNPVAVVRGKARIMGERAAAAVLASLQAWRARRRPRPSPHEIRTIERFDSRHDRLWEDHRGAYRCAVVRDASYLNWKYVDQPGQSFIRLEVCRRGQPVAAVVVTVRGEEPGYAYRRGFITELVAVPDSDVLIATLEVAVSALRSAGADLAVCDVIGGPVEGALKTYGFLSRAPERFLLVSTVGADAPLAAAMEDPGNWYVTSGDSDIDRPW